MRDAFPAPINRPQPPPLPPILEVPNSPTLGPHVTPQPQQLQVPLPPSLLLPFQRTRSGRVTQPPIPYWIVNNTNHRQSILDTSMRTAPGLSTTQQPRQIDVASAESFHDDEEEVLSAISNLNT